MFSGSCSICSDLFRFAPISSGLFSSDLFWFAFLVFWNLFRFCSDLLRFLPICFQNKSGKTPSADPFCTSPSCAEWDNPKSLGSDAKPLAYGGKSFWKFLLFLSGLSVWWRTWASNCDVQHGFVRERRFSPKFFRPKFLEAPKGRGRPRLRVMDIRAQMHVFPGFWVPWPKFWARISARMTPGCPRDIRPKNFLFGLIFRSWFVGVVCGL